MNAVDYKILVYGSVSVCLNALGSFAKKKGGERDYNLRHAYLYVRHSALNISALNGRIFIKFNILRFLEHISRNFKFQ